MTQVIDTLKDFYQEFSTERMAKLGDVYGDNIVFEDPVHRICGLDSLQKYFERSAKGLTHCKFEFTNHSLSESSATLEWVMHYQHPRLKSGEMLSLDGISFIRFDDKVIYQRDYYDMGAMVYEHVPLLGCVVRYIKSKFAD